MTTYKTWIVRPLRGPYSGMAGIVEAELGGLVRVMFDTDTYMIFSRSELHWLREVELSRREAVYEPAI